MVVPNYRYLDTYYKKSTQLAPEEELLTNITHALHLA